MPNHPHRLSMEASRSRSLHSKGFFLFCLYLVFTRGVDERKTSKKSVGLWPVRVFNR